LKYTQPAKDNNAVHMLFEPLNFTDSQALRLHLRSTLAHFSNFDDTLFDAYQVR